MSYYGLQVTLIFVLTFINSEAKKPPGYVAPPKEYDPNPPKYEYGYRIQEEKATHGKDERRDGVYAQGRYYVEKGTESSQSVKYFADDWGYHPVVEYSNNGPYSKSSTNFVLGEEAIKLKNNQKSIPQDPSDPGKAVNLAKLDPSNQNQLQSQQYVFQSSTPLPAHNQPQLLVQQPQQVLIENQSENPTVIQPQQNQPQIVVQQSPSHYQPQLLIEQPQVEIQPTPNIQHVLNDQPAASDNNNQQQLVKLISSHDPQTITLHSTPQPEILLQNQPEDPHKKEENNHLDPSEINNQPVLIDSQPQPKEVLIQQTAQAQSPLQPLFYYVQPQQNQYDVNIQPSAAESQLIDQSPQPQINIQLTGAENQLLYPLQQYRPLHQQQQILNSNEVLPQLTANQNVGFPQKAEVIPQPQALIYHENKQNVIIEGQNNPTGPSENDQQTLINNGFTDIKENSGQLLETAALIKIPNQIVDGSSQYQEFGAKLKPKSNIESSGKDLIESTKNLVSGLDVLNINAAVSHSFNDEIESSTLQSLLNQYVTPTIVNNHVNVDVNHFEVISSTTIAPPITTIETSLLREPIIAAESPDDSHNKPVLEDTDENKPYFPSTSRSSLVSSTTIASLPDESSSEQILVTPRPVSSKFLAPITAGVQLQHIEEPIFEDTKTIETQGGYQKKKNVLVQVQKTIPYYLGMYEYPLGYAAQYRGHNITEQEKAMENIELGKTLLYFPEPERFVHEGPKAQPSQGIPEVYSNHLPGQQLPSKHIKQSFVEIDQQTLQGKQQLFIDKALTGQQSLEQIGGTESKVEQKFYVQQLQHQLPPDVTKVVHHAYPVPYPVVQNVPYPVEKIVDRPVHVPVQVTKYVDRPYPIEVPVPYPQPYAVEKIVKEPYPVPVHVQVPVSVEKIIKEPYPVPVHVRVPVPHPVAVEKIVERKVPVPYYIEKPVEKIVEKPVEKIVERKVPVPYYLDRVVEKQVPHYINRPYPVGVPVQNQAQLQQAYLLQIPGLFSQQRYSTLVHNTYPTQNLQIQYSLKGHQNKNQDQYQVHNLGYQGVNPYSYAAQINQYLPPKHDVHINRGQITPKLKKLNLLVFPRLQVPINLPHVTNNAYDLQQSQSYQSFRHSNAQLDNGYLPPLSLQQNGDHSDHLQASASNSNNYNVKHPEGDIGLIPPKRQQIEDSRKHRAARSHFDDKSIRLEYGFMPPLVPSLEIDEQGRPIEQDDNKN